MTKQAWYNYILSFKFPFRIFAIHCILLIGLVTGIITYKTIYDVLDFFELSNVTESKIGDIFNIMTSTLVALATIVQSAPIIWDRLSYWGQLANNYISYYFFNKKNFIDEAEELLGKYRKLLDQANNKMQKIIWTFLTKEKTRKKIYLSGAIDKIINLYLKKAYHIQKRILRLINNNESYDNISISKKHEIELNLNSLIMTLSQTCEEIAKIKHKLQELKKG